MILYLLGAAIPAFACVLAPPQTLVVDPTLADAEAPLAPELVSVDVQRGVGPRGGPFTVTITSCDDVGAIAITLARPEGDTDDETTVGYRFSLVDGTLPDGLQLPADDGAPWVGPVLNLAWIDGAEDDQDAVLFTVALTPVDAAGNEGEPIEVDVADVALAPGGCSTVPGAGAGLWLAAFVAVRWGRRDRRASA